MTPSAAGDRQAPDARRVPASGAQRDCRRVGDGEIHQDGEPDRAPQVEHAGRARDDGSDDKLQRLRAKHEASAAARAIANAVRDTPRPAANRESRPPARPASARGVPGRRARRRPTARREPSAGTPRPPTNHRPPHQGQGDADARACTTLPLPAWRSARRQRNTARRLQEARARSRRAPIRSRASASPEVATTTAPTHGEAVAFGEPRRLLHPDGL